MNSEFPLVAQIDIASSSDSIKRLTESTDVSVSTPPGKPQVRASRRDGSASSGFAVPEALKDTAKSLAHVLRFPPWLQEYLGIKPAEPLPAGMCLAWHPITGQIAVASTSSIVHVCNAGSAKAKKQSSSAVNLQSEQVLAHDIQQQVGALAWRPHSGQQLAVGCSNGVCLWSFGKCPAGGAPALKVAVEGTHQTAWLSFLRAYQTGPVTALAWHPKGQLLAAAVHNRPGFTIFDVSTGLFTPVAAGLTPVSLLSWAPNSEYVLEGSIDGSFRIWETHKWTHAAWASQGSAQALCGAAWAPDSKAVLVSNKGAKELSALYFTQRPPGMEAQIFPVSLPASGKDAGTIQSFAWDTAGQRLAVALDGAHRRIAVYATAHKPILTLRLLGTIPLSSEGSSNGRGDQAQSALSFSPGGILARQIAQTKVQLHACDSI